jgi:CheY-like chemotaxis protein
VDRIVRLVERFEVFRRRRGRSFEPLNIHEVLDHVRRLAKNGFAAQGIRFIEEFDPSLPPVHGNRDQLVQVLLNLVKNAAEAIGERAAKRGNRPLHRLPPRRPCFVPSSGERISLPLEVCVIDNGPGIARHLVPHLFDPFVTTKSERNWPRSCNGRKDRKRPRRRHRMRRVKRGTRFRMLLPVMKARPAAVEAEERPCPTGRTILVADDDAAIRTVVTQALTRAGYEVRATGTAGVLWRWVAAGEGDLVITDVVMPDENIFDVLPRIRHMRPDLPVIVMSAQNTFMTAIKASERGAYRLPAQAVRSQRTGQPGRRARWPPPRPVGRRSGEEPPDDIPLVGRSPAMQDIYRVLARLMQTDLTVIITGEAAPARNWWRGRCMISASASAGRSSPSTWRPSRRT